MTFFIQSIATQSCECFVRARTTVTAVRDIDSTRCAIAVTYAMHLALTETRRETKWTSARHSGCGQLDCGRRWRISRYTSQTVYVQTLDIQFYWYSTSFSFLFAEPFPVSRQRLQDLNNLIADILCLVLTTEVSSSITCASLISVIQNLPHGILNSLRGLLHAQ